MRYQLSRHAPKVALWPTRFERIPVRRRIPLVRCAGVHAGITPSVALALWLICLLAGPQDSQGAFVAFADALAGSESMDDSTFLPVGSTAPLSVSAFAQSATNVQTLSALAAYQSTALGGDFRAQSRARVDAANGNQTVRAKASGRFDYLVTAALASALPEIRVRSLIPIDGDVVALGAVGAVFGDVSWQYEVTSDAHFVDQSQMGSLAFSSRGNGITEASVQGEFAADVTLEEGTIPTAVGDVDGWSMNGISIVDIPLDTEGRELDFIISVVYTLETTVNTTGGLGGLGVADFFNTSSFDLSIVDPNGDPIPDVTITPIGGVPEPSTYALGLVGSAVFFVVSVRARQSRRTDSMYV